MLDTGNRVADTRFADVFDACGKIADLTCGKRFTRLSGFSSHIAEFRYSVFRTGCHHTNGISGFYSSIHYTDIYNNALVAVIVGVKNQCL